MSASPRPDILGSVLASDEHDEAVRWSVKYTPDGFLMRRLQPKKSEFRRPSTEQARQPQNKGQSSDLKNSLLASTPVNSSHEFSAEQKEPNNAELQNFSGLNSAINNPASEGRSSNPNVLPDKLPVQTRYIRISESRAPAKKLQESASISSQSQSGLKKTVEKLQSHIAQLEDRQKKLESHEAKMEEILQKVQQRTEQLPPIREPPRTVEIKKNSKTCRINSKLVSLTVENPPNALKKKSADTSRDDLKREIRELKELVCSIKEQQAKRTYLPQKEMEAGNGAYDLPSLEGEFISKTMVGPQKGSSQFSGSPFPSKELPERSDKLRERITIGDMKTVFFSGAVYQPNSLPKTTTINEQPSSEIDIHRDVFVNLNKGGSSQSKKQRRKKSTDNIFNARNDQMYANANRPSFDTRYDTTKRMEHNGRNNQALIINQGRLKSFNPEQLDQEKFRQTKKSSKPMISLQRPAQEEEEVYNQTRFVPHSIKLEPKERYAKDTPDANFEDEEPVDQVQHNISPSPTPQELMEEESPGEISVIQLAQFRTSEDLHKKLAIFPKLPGPLNPLLNSEDLTNLAKQTFAVFGYQIAENSALTIKKYRNCVYFCHQKKHILWHYSGKFYIGGWDGNGKEEGCKSGKGIELIPGNYMYQGQFNNGKRQGFGVVNSVKGDNYVGHWYQGLRHGKGRLEEASGAIYDGHWKHGKKDGMGKLVFHGLEVYEGGFEDGLKHGFGRQQFRNKDTYKGEYSMGRFSGEGTYKWANGAVYQGQFLNGMRHGHGCWKSSRQGRSDSYQGDYFQDKKSGHGRYAWENGTIYEGRFLNDMKHGQGELRYPDGAIIRGIWERGTLKYETYNSKNVPPTPAPNFKEEPTRAVQISGNFPF